MGLVMGKKYGNTIWVKRDIYLILKDLVEKSATPSIRPSMNDVVADLLSLRRLPRYILDKLKNESNPEIQTKYKEILKFIIYERNNNKVKNNDD